MRRPRDGGSLGPLRDPRGMTMTPIRTLVLLAGAEDARFLINDGVGKGLTEVLALSSAQFADLAPGFADAPTRGYAPGGTGFAVDPGTAPDERRRAVFADRVIEALAQEWPVARADRLVLAAAPKMLGLLRVRLSGAPKAALAADLDRDLVHLPLCDLGAHLDGILVV